MTDAGDLAVMADIIGTSERLRVFIPQGPMSFLKKNSAGAPKKPGGKKDGLDINTFEFTVAEKFGLRLARDPQVAAHLYQWDGGKGLENIARKAVTSSGASV